MLMHEPRHFARMAREVGRELRADEQIDRPAVALAEIEQPPHRGVREDFRLRIPLEGEAHQFGVESALAELAHQLARQRLGAAANERHLRFADHDGLDGITWHDGN